MERLKTQGYRNGAWQGDKVLITQLRNNLFSSHTVESLALRIVEGVSNG